MQNTTHEEKIKNVLVLCTGNSCRSIMGEALINALAGKSYRAVSAGSNPTGEVHPQSIAALKRHGVSVNAPRSKSWHEFDGKPFDLVVTVCDNAAKEPCPIFLGKHKKLHFSIPDPAGVVGGEEEIVEAFDKAFALLKKHIEEELLNDV